MVTPRTRRHGTRVAIALASAAVLMTAGGVPVASAHGNQYRSNQTLDAVLLGANERPTAGDPDGRGKVQLKLKATQICFTLSWRNIDAPTAAHIHVGARNVAGPVVTPFMSVPGGLAAPVNSVGGCTAADPALIKAIKKQPRNYYVNVHNAAFPAGAIRGQLH